MIRTSLRILLRRRNRTFVNALCSKNSSNTRLSVAKRKGDLSQILPKIFIDRLPRRWLKVGSSGVKWAIAPRDQWTPIPNPNASMPESSGIPLTRKIGSPSHRAGGAIVLRISFFCLRRHTNFCWSCRQKNSRKWVRSRKQTRMCPRVIAAFFCDNYILALNMQWLIARAASFCR